MSLLLNRTCQNFARVLDTISPSTSNICEFLPNTRYCQGKRLKSAQTLWIGQILLCQGVCDRAEGGGVPEVIRLRLETGAANAAGYSTVDEWVVHKTRAEVCVGVHNRSLAKGWAAHVHKIHQGLTHSGCEAKRGPERPEVLQCWCCGVLPSQSRVTYSDLWDNIQSPKVCLIRSTKKRNWKDHKKKFCRKVAKTSQVFRNMSNYRSNINRMKAGEIKTDTDVGTSYLNS